MQLTYVIIFLFCINGIFAITREEVLTRAESWVKHGVKYSMEGAYKDPEGKEYRSDCSGFVSMAWKLPTAMSTVTLPEVAHKITEGELKAGDIMCHCGPGTAGAVGHVLIFDKWAEGKKEYYAYEQHGPTGSPTEHHLVPYPFRDNDHRFVPMRYAHITD